MPDTKPPRGRPPERISVIVNFGRSFTTTGQAETVPWPKGWPFPSVGDHISVGDRSGFVEHLSFAPLTGKLVINTR